VCDELKQAIIERGRVQGEFVIVDRFLNHRIDIPLMRTIAGWLAERLPTADLVVTSEASGIAPAVAVGEAMELPVVFAKKRGQPREGMLARQVESATKGDRPWLEMAPHVLDGVGTAVVVDDFLAHGRTSLALAEMIMDAGIDVLGFGFAVERTFAGGRAKLEAAGHLVVSAAIVTEIRDGKPILA
jgi:xanthine phosphoribosyltransferase